MSKNLDVAPYWRLCCGDGNGTPIFGSNIRFFKKWKNENDLSFIINLPILSICSKFVQNLLFYRFMFFVHRCYVFKICMTYIFFKCMIFICKKCELVKKKKIHTIFIIKLWDEIFYDVCFWSRRECMCSNCFYFRKSATASSFIICFCNMFLIEVWQSSSSSCALYCKLQSL